MDIGGVQMENSSRFFANRECQYYPCHKGIEELNCLFCYCPFYLREHCPGNPAYFEKNGNRIKDCTNCTFPHRPESYDIIVEWIRKQNQKKEANGMQECRKVRNRLLGAKVVEALKSRNMEAWYAETKEEALKQALSLIPDGSSISWGGSMSIQEIGLVGALKSKESMKIFDRDSVNTPEERTKMMREAFFCDYFLASSNAVSEDGILVNIDGYANRVAAIAYGPENVLMVVGINKVVKTEADALSRARSIAATSNAQRFPINTPCKKTGACANCKMPDTICCQFLTTRYSKAPGRIKVILVGEELGL